MVQQVINVGTNPNDHTGDPLRTAFTKANGNFTELYANDTAARIRVSGGTQTINVNNATGNDATGSLTLPFKTWQAAINYVANALDGNGQQLIILGDGATYTAPINMTLGMVGWDFVTIDGGHSTINATNNNAIRISAPVCGEGLQIQNFTLTTAGTAHDCIQIAPAASGIVFLGAGMVFGSCTSGHIRINGQGCELWPTANYSITAAAQWHVIVYEGGFFNGGETSVTVTLSGVQTYSQFFLYAESGTIDVSAIAWTGGTITATRIGIFHGDIKTDTGGQGSIIPGNSDGWCLNGFYG